jgi:hypothetical protein
MFVGYARLLGDISSLKAELAAKQAENALLRENLDSHIKRFAQQK